MDILAIALIITTFLCSLTAGFLFAFAVVAMPGIKNLNDKEFIRAFQVMDKVIQNNQPIFMLVWAGSVVVLIITAGLSFGKLEGLSALLMGGAVLCYLLGVQLPTATMNIPLNNTLQSHDVDTMTAEILEKARQEFEPRWNQWNMIRTGFASLTSLLLIILLSL